MPRPEYFTTKLKNIVFEEINKLQNHKNKLFKIFSNKIKTDFKIINKKIYGYKTIVYRFETNNKNSYDLEFIINIIETDIILDNGNMLKDILIDNPIIIKCCDISFTPTERIDDFNDNIDIINYADNTNKNETIELMNRISFLIDEFINKNSIEIFVIGKNTLKSKLNIYLKIFDNLFSNDFKTFEGENLGYDEGAYYFIKNKILI